MAVAAGCPRRSVSPEIARTVGQREKPAVVGAAVDGWYPRAMANASDGFGGRFGGANAPRTPGTSGASLPFPAGDPRIQWFAEAPETQKHAAVHALIAVATGDGVLKPEEKTAIAAACERLGVGSVDVAAALARRMPDRVDPPTDPRARMQLMLDCAAVMVADNRIDDRELAVLLMVGKSLGFTTAQIGDIASHVAQALATSQRRQGLIERLLDEMS